MKVLILVTDTSRGGAPVRCASMALGLRDRGWDPMVVSVKPGGPILDDLASRAVAVDSLNLTSTSGVPAAMTRLRRIVNAWRPDVVQASLWHANLLARLGLRGRIPVLCTVEGVDTTKSSARIWLDRLTRRRGLRFVAVCGAVSRVATKRDWVAPDDLVVIPTGIDLDYWQCDGRRPAVRAEWQVSEATPVVGWAGRLAPEKNVPALLAALETLPGWRLAVAGDGPMRSSMQREIRDRDLSGRVIDLGELVDMRPFLEAIDVFALPSTEEGLPVAMLEAMAMQRPVVAAPVGGIPELIVPGENGLLVDADDPAALARSILSAHRTPELGSRGRQSVRASHSLVAMLDAYDALWRSVIGSTIHR